MPILLLALACRTPVGSDSSTSPPGNEPDPVDLTPTLVDDDLPLHDEAHWIAITVYGSLSRTEALSQLAGALHYGHIDIDIYESLGDSGMTRVSCQAVVTLAGEAYAEDCEGCDFAYALTSSVEGEACPLDPVLAFQESESLRSPRLAYWGERRTVVDGEERVATAVLANGASPVDSATGEVGAPEWRVIAEDRVNGVSTGDSVEYLQDEAQLNLYVYEERVDTEGAPQRYDTCGATSLISEGQEVQSASPQAGDLPSFPGAFADAWQLDLSAASRVRISVNTTHESYLGNFGLWLNDPAGCTIARSNSSFPCRYNPGSGDCPALDVPVTTPGIYTAYVVLLGGAPYYQARYEISATATPLP